jgi:hypothetical protein
MRRGSPGVSGLGAGPSYVLRMAPAVAGAALVAVCVGAVAATSSLAARGAVAPTHKRAAQDANAISPASAFSLPSTSACVRGRALVIQLRQPRRARWTKVTVLVNGPVFRTLRSSHITRTIRLTGLPAGRFVLSITATTSRGKSVRARRSYRACNGSEAPTIIEQPVSQTVPVGGFLKLEAKASAKPVPLVTWQVSPDLGKTWNALVAPTRESSSQIFHQVADGTAGAFSGYEYRAVFSNSAGTATTTAVMATTPVDQTSDFDGYSAFAPEGRTSRR